MYAVDLARRGHDIRLVVEGEATRCLLEREGRFAELFEEARALGVLVGLCKAASGGCSDASRSVTRLAQESGLMLMDTLDGHAGIASFVEEGYEVVTF
jgi:hypothetical protein